METSLEVKKHLRRLKLAHIPKNSDPTLLKSYVRSLELILLASEVFDKQRIGQNGFEPVVVTCLTELFEPRLPALEGGDLQTNIKRALLRLLANNFSGSDTPFSEITVLLHAVLRAANPSTSNDGSARELKVSYHALDGYVGIANDFTVSMRTMARESSYYQNGDSSNTRQPTQCH